MKKESSRTLAKKPARLGDLKALKSLAGWLARRGASPSAFTLAGVGFAAVAGEALWSSSHLAPSVEWISFPIAAVFIPLSYLSGLLGDMVASRRGSPAGEMEEVPERIADAAILIGAGYAAGGNAVLGCLAACVVFFGAYIGAAGKAAGAARERCGPMTREHRMLLLTLVSVYCAAAPAAWQPVWGLMAIALLVVVLGETTTAARRLQRITSQIRKGTPA